MHICLIWTILCMYCICKQQYAVTIQPATASGSWLVTIAAMMNINSPGRETDMPVIHCILHQCLCVDMFYWWNTSVCCLLQTVWSVPLMLTVCWLTWLHAFGPPSSSHSVPVPLTVNHGNVIMHGNFISHDVKKKKKEKGKKLIINSSMFFFSYVFFIFSLCLSGSSWFVFCSLKCSQCQRLRRPREMTLQWMWTSRLL